LLIVMRHGATDAEIQRVIAVIEELGYKASLMPGAQRTAVGLVGNDGRVDASRLEALPGVQEVIHVSKPYKQVSREWKDENTVVRLPGGIAVAERRRHHRALAPSRASNRSRGGAAGEEAGATILRGGAWKPRSSPYSFQGLGRPGLKLPREGAGESGLLICHRSDGSRGRESRRGVADIVQIGARNMQNFSLLKARPRAQARAPEARPVGDDRGAAALRGVPARRGESRRDSVRARHPGFDTTTRNVFDLTAIPVVHKLSHLPIIADPSHGTGLRDKVIPMARAAVAAGADGIIVEVHPHPDQAFSRMGAVALPGPVRPVDARGCG